MYIFRTVEDLQAQIAKWRKKGEVIGFVPTLGALHNGHLSLMKRAHEDSDIVVCSIFVNPTQFNESTDLAKYPRTITEDIQVLLDGEIDALFFPNDQEVYPEGLDTLVDIDLGSIAEVMEAEERPGHFEGVMQVVKRLLDIVQPDNLYMGQKDFQQFTIIQHMIDYLKMPTQLIVCPIIREEHGLAMSSRNERLNVETREAAKIIYETLQHCKEKWNKSNAKELEAKALEKLTSDIFRAEYFKIVDGYSLEEISDDNNLKYVVACAAVWADDVRLIDNIIF